MGSAASIAEPDEHVWAENGGASEERGAVVHDASGSYLPICLGRALVELLPSLVELALPKSLHIT